MEKTTPRHTLPLLVLSTYVILIHFSWLGQSQAYPYGDAASYLMTAQRTYVTYQTEGLAAAVRFAYSFRGWKPVAQQYLILPFLTATGGDVRAAFRLYSPLMTMAFLTALYALVLRVGARRLEATLAVLGLGTTAWALSNQSEYLSELPWLFCCVLFFLNWPRAGENASWRGATLWLGLGLLVRPVEVAISLIPPYLYDFIRRQKFERRPGLTLRMLLEGGAALILAIYPYFLAPVRQNFSIAAQLIIFCAISGYLAFRYFRERASILPWTVLLASIVIWYMPHFEQLMDWLWMSTSGHRVKSAGVNQNFSGELFIFFWIRLASPLLFIPLFISLVHWQKSFNHWKSQAGLYFALAWAGFSFALVASFTDSRDPRYYQLGWVAIYMLGLAGWFAWAQARRYFPLVLAAGLVFHLFWIYPEYANFFGGRVEPRRLWTYRNWSGLFYYHSFPRELSAEFTMFNDHLFSLTDQRTSHIALIQTKYRHSGTTYGHSHVLRGLERGRWWETHDFQDSFDSGRSIDQNLAFIFEEFNFVVVKPPPAGSTYDSDRLARYFLECAPEECARRGFQEIASVAFPKTESDPAETFHTFRILRPPSSP